MVQFIRLHTSQIFFRVKREYSLILFFSTLFSGAYPVEVLYRNFAAGSHTLDIQFTTTGGGSGTISTIFTVPERTLFA